MKIPVTEIDQLLALGESSVIPPGDRVFLQDLRARPDLNGTVEAKLEELGKFGRLRRDYSVKSNGHAPPAEEDQDDAAACEPPNSQTGAGPKLEPDPAEAATLRKRHRAKRHNSNADIEFSEDGLALDFTSRHAHELRYVASWGVWLYWDGARWTRERTLKVYDMARRAAREAVDRGGDPRQLLKAKTVAAIEKLAQSDRRTAAVAEQWDADHWLLNTCSGIAHLQTGDMQSHDPLRYMTKIATTGPQGDCPRWLQFLDEITTGDTELQGFLQRVVGYALTGSTREHALFFAYGTGANGRGVFINTISAILGDYATTAPMETFVATQGDRHPTELAGLRGARLVTAQETEQGRRWAESKIKALTGGDPIAARFMRQDFFEFTPQFKLLIAGNHKPGLRGVDEAIRRRFYLIPFTVTIPPEKRDQDLFEKLKSEWGGILQWMIEGCLAWRREGLNAPAIVREATEAYLAAEDACAQWMEECCACDAVYAERTADLFASWKSWAEAAGEFVGSQKRFSQAIEDRGFARDHNSLNQSIFRGLALRHDRG